jgi:hypothetical protein
MIGNQDKIIETNAVYAQEISLKNLILSFGDWLSYLLSKWLFICALVLIGGILALGYSFIQRPTYTALTTFVLEDGDKMGGSLGQYSGLASLAGLDIGGGGGSGIFQGDNIIELYKSRSMVQNTLLSTILYNGKAELLINRYIDFKKLRDEWSGEPELEHLKFENNPNKRLTRLQDSILSKAVEDINKEILFVSKPDKKLSIIKVEVKSKDEFFSKNFNEQIVKRVNDFYVQTKTKKSLKNVSVLQHQTDSVRNVLNGFIYQSVSVADATPNLNLTRMILRAPAQKLQISAEANKAILSELVKNLELAKLSLRRETPLIQVVDAPIYPLYSNKITKTKAIIIGSIAFGMLTILGLLFKRAYKQVMA